MPDIVSGEDGGKTYGELWPEYIRKQKRLIARALELAGSDIPDQVAIESIGGGWTGHEALAIAIYSAIKHQDSFEDAVISCVNHSGDSDSTGAICGNIMGCLLSRSAIPAHFTDKLELLDIIEEMANDLYTGSLISEYNHYGTPEMARWDEKYCNFHWEPIK
ncbi:MAG: ADP-ribosylglycohydrolase family protein [Bacteroidales bacterium]|jgi:ADP-ribosylglycohydrolase|nr:ADP-ribosylglycohydrolase family protein [Bacteroidales bacterium]